MLIWKSRCAEPFARTLGVAVVSAAFCVVSASQVPDGYKGVPFNDAAYRAAQIANEAQPTLPWHAFSPELTVFDAKNPKGSGWVGPEEPGASIGLDEADPQGRRFIHYRVELSNYRYAVFGWRWAGENEPPTDLSRYDAISFSIRISGPKPPQELFFGVDALNPRPLSLRDYDPVFSDGSWHRVTIPTRAMRWDGENASSRTVRGFSFKTFVWDPAQYEIQLDQFTLDRASKVSAGAMASPTETAGDPQKVPGRIQAAFYDLGGEGIAYHDTTPVNTLSAVLNQQGGHRRPHATTYEWNFRRDEGVDVSFTKDWADLNHPNLFDIGPNQLYIGSTEDGEWANYTVDVAHAGKYKIVAAYGNDKNGQSFEFWLNGKPATVCTPPVTTGGMHIWNKAEVGTITFPHAGRQLLTLHYRRGFNLAYFDFVQQ